MDNILTAKSVLESASNPIIAYGGQSSSEALNNINENLRSDLLMLESEMTTIEQDLATNKALLSCQSSAMGAATARVQDLLADIRTVMVSTQGRVPIDMFDDRYVVDASTTATVDTTFGQATLGVTGQSDWLVARDLEGTVWIPSTTQVKYYTSDSPSRPTSDKFKMDPNFAIALDGDPGTMWVRERSLISGTENYSEPYIFIEINVPTDVVTNALANALVIRPFPVMCHDLVSVWVKSQGGSEQQLIGSKLQYLPGYSATEQVVKTIGDIRLFFDPVQVSKITIMLKAGNFPFWGFSELALKTITFQATSVLELDMSAVAGGKTLRTVTLKGRDEAYLATLIPKKTSTGMSVTLTQQGAGYTPVITIVDTTWS